MYFFFLRKIFAAIILLTFFFYLPLSLFFFWDSCYTYVGTCNDVSHFPEALFTFFFISLFIFLRSYSLYHCIVKSDDSSSCQLTSPVYPFQHFVFQVGYGTSQFQNAHFGLFCMISISILQSIFDKILSNFILKHGYLQLFERIYKGCFEAFFKKLILTSLPLRRLFYHLMFFPSCFFLVSCMSHNSVLKIHL